MMHNDPLIEQLRNWDARQANQSVAPNSEELVQCIVQTAAVRRARRRSVGRLTSGACALVGVILWYWPWQSQNNVLHHVPIAVQARPEPTATETPNESIASTEKRQPQRETLMPVRSSLELQEDAAREDQEMRAELQRWREEHARLRRRLDELETMILREELSRKLEDDDVTNGIFF